MAEDYYKTLGVKRDASQAEIDKAYAALARKLHPDLNPDDKSAKKKFQELQAAYDVLKDKSKREMYDRYGSSFESAGGGARPGWTWNRSGQGQAEDVDFSQFFGDQAGAGSGASFADLFEQLQRGAGGRAGRRGRSAARSRGADMEYEVEVPFTISVAGGDVQLAIEREQGRTETIAVKIPAGIQDGQKLRLRGQGQPSPGGGTPGDMSITVRVSPHPAFTRRGEHLEVKVPVTLREAAEGAKIDVPTPTGQVSLRIPPGTSSGKRLRIKGHGVAARGRPPGDLYAQIQIVLPENLDKRSLELVREFDARHPLDPRRGLRW